MIAYAVPGRGECVTIKLGTMISMKKEMYVFDFHGFNGIIDT